MNTGGGGGGGAEGYSRPHIFDWGGGGAGSYAYGQFDEIEFSI